MIDIRHAFDGRLQTALRAGVRAITVALLATITLVPSLARTQDRLHRAPVDEYSRFHWTNSCESVPQKVAPRVVAAPIESPAQTTLDAPGRAWARLPRAVTPVLSDPLPSAPRSLRAPPASV